MIKQVPEETFSSPEHQAWLKERKKQDPLDPQPIPSLEGADSARKERKPDLDDSFDLWLGGM
jgi:hypothetical protein